MAIEPLQTDEPLNEVVVREQDTDTVMLWGCGSFVVSSVTIFVLGVTPFFIIQDIGPTNSLLLALAVGCLPALLLGVIVTRKRGLPAACGTLGGFMVVGVFLHLRIQQAFTAAMAQQASVPEYPAFMAYLIPTSAVLIGLLVAFISYRVETSVKSP